MIILDIHGYIWWNMSMKYIKYVSFARMIETQIFAKSKKFSG